MLATPVRQLKTRLFATRLAQSATAQGWQKLGTEILDIIRETGVSTGVARTATATQAGASLITDILRNPSSYYTDSASGISGPKVLRALFERLGATYVKLGQFIASSPTLFPAEYVMEFQKCLDKAPTIPFNDIRETVQRDLGIKLPQAFAYVDPRPLASASIAQVHRARLITGEDVVLKVRKPGVEEVLKADLAFVYATSKILEYFNPGLSRVSLSAIVGDLRESMLCELDFRQEASNILAFREFLQSNGITRATAPQVYTQYSNKEVLTLEFLDGVPLTDLEGIKKFTPDPEGTLITALNTWALSVASSDFFHADVHGGNLLVLKDGRVGFIDFGIVGRVSDKVWGGMQKLAISLADSDYRGAAEALVSIGATDTEVNIDVFARDIESVTNKVMALTPEIVIRTREGELSAQVGLDTEEVTRVTIELVEVADRNGLKLPREFGLLIKQALYFDRYNKLLAPTLDPLRDDRVGVMTTSSSPRRSYRPPQSTTIIDVTPL